MRKDEREREKNRGRHCIAIVPLSPPLSLRDTQSVRDIVRERVCVWKREKNLLAYIYI